MCVRYASSEDGFHVYMPSRAVARWGRSGPSARLSFLPNSTGGRSVWNGAPPSTCITVGLPHPGPSSPYPAACTHETRHCWCGLTGARPRDVIVHGCGAAALEPPPRRSNSAIVPCRWWARLTSSSSWPRGRPCPQGPCPFRGQTWTCLDCAQWSRHQRSSRGGPAGSCLCTSGGARWPC